MILTRHQIVELIDSGVILFSPELDGFQNQPHAIDLRLGTVFYLSKTWEQTSEGRKILTVDMTDKNRENSEKIEIKPGQYFELAPGESVTASTLERVEIRAGNLMGVLYPRSSTNRRGLSVDMTGIVDAGYHGHLMVPIINKTQSQIIRLYPGERVCQIVFHLLSDSLTETDMKKHGKTVAKYHDAGDGDLGSRPDSDEEMELIRRGNLKELKKTKF